jgi:hypothetical protein
MTVVSIVKQREEQTQKDREDHLHTEAAIEILENTLKLLKNNNLEDIKDFKKNIVLTLNSLRKNRKWSVQRL